jgi:hypothetical protein
MTRAKIYKKKRNLKRISCAVDFYRYYGTEREYGKAIIKEQDIKKKIIELEEKKKKWKSK